jgi:hypothetical protein
MFLPAGRVRVGLSRVCRYTNPGAVPPIETAVPGAYGVRGGPLGRAPFQRGFLNPDTAGHVERMHNTRWQDADGNRRTSS